MNPIDINRQFPPDKEKVLRKAVRITWMSIVAMISIIVVLGLTMGSSQAMKTLWFEDMLSLIPSTAFLIGAHYRKRHATRNYPYGYRRAVLIGYFIGAIALLGLG